MKYGGIYIDMDHVATRGLALEGQRAGPKLEDKLQVSKAEPPRSQSIEIKIQNDWSSMYPSPNSKSASAVVWAVSQRSSRGGQQTQAALMKSEVSSGGGPSLRTRLEDGTIPLVLRSAASCEPSWNGEESSSQAREL